ncbi:hypothetical protein AB6A40_004809 [Gnathostoma spinigerum]|uniref:Dynein light chain n=1 Tax=Gnathostoma spinigerum TaxID=75299 RepID=A0ABD6EES3_9BILA
MSLNAEPMITIQSVEMEIARARVAQQVAKDQLMNGVVDQSQIARVLKEKFDEAYGPSWNCIVGNSFGSYISHRTNNFIHFYIDNIAVLLYKSS